MTEQLERRVSSIPTLLVVAAILAMAVPLTAAATEATVTDPIVVIEVPTGSTVQSPEPGSQTTVTGQPPATESVTALTPAGVDQEAPVEPGGITLGDPEVIAPAGVSPLVWLFVAGVVIAAGWLLFAFLRRRRSDETTGYVVSSKPVTERVRAIADERVPSGRQSSLVDPVQDPSTDETRLRRSAQPSFNGNGLHSGRGTAGRGTAVETEVIPETIIDLRDQSATPLTAIEGIGPAMARRLGDLGIKSVEQLARLDENGIADLRVRLGGNAWRFDQGGWYLKARRLVRGF